MDVNLLFGSGFKQAGSPLMEMKLIFSLIETGALPASFLGITNLSFLFYSPPRCKSKVIITFAVFRHYQEYFSKQKRIGRVLQFIGTRTLDIYLLHYILIPRDLKMVGCFFKTYTNPLLEFSVSILLALVIIVACLAMSATIRSSTFMSSLLFGVKSKSNNIING